MPDCPFCRIAEHYKSEICTTDDEINPPAYVILSTSLCLAFLDILPLSSGHLLVVTRQHREKISDVTKEESRELGAWISILSRVLAKVTGVWDWNIVQNNGAAAAQVVKHVHFHVIPRPTLSPDMRNKSFTMFGKGHRSVLDPKEAYTMAQRLRSELEREVKSMKQHRL